MAAINADDRTTTRRPVSPNAPRDLQETCFLTDHDVREILERKFRDGEFRVIDWRLEPLDLTMGFLGRYYHLRVTVRRVGHDRTEDLRFFAKSPPAADNPVMMYVRRNDAFNKEIAVYIDLIRRMDPVGRLQWTVECYLGKRDVIIVLEDASSNGYVTMDKYVPFDEEHFVWLLRSLARLHSRSVILDERLRRETGRTVIDVYGRLLAEPFFARRDDRVKATLTSCVLGMYAVIELMRELDEHGKTIVRRQIDRWIRRLPRLLEPSRKRRNVVCHRDTWANNLMFRYDAAGKPCGCYLIDFQFFCYCPPAIDFVFCLYMTTDRATRDRNFDAFARIYHDSFAGNLAEEGLDAEECLPWAEFRESCEETRNIGLIYACTNLQIILLSDEAINDYFHDTADKLTDVLIGSGRADMVRRQCLNVPVYRARLTEIVLEIKDRLPEHPPNL
ncbi:PREDICTED: uncharacterized protein LOC106742713 [Dinoponera quadriceps]|uniref:Uncharacterized protein LOC106742713 n=1 Tax=Dinoponera quadriceps TaxID=609295 RepID=A0A6P3WZ79_DINQU|nr:PREDICTED: uncharacterized protein LOC106742713 [Dinoponera quadriceps]